MVLNTVEAILSMKIGLMKSQKFRRLHSTRRVKTLRLSTLIEIENAHSSGINSIDLDKVEGR